MLNSLSNQDKNLFKKISKKFFVIFIAIFIVQLLIYMDYTRCDYSLGDGYEIHNDLECTDLFFIDLRNRYKNFVMSNIDDYRYNSRYIIFKRFPYYDFKCYDEKSKDYTKSVSCMLLDKEYIILDKEKHKLYATYDEDKFYHRLWKMNIELTFYDNKPYEYKKHVYEPMYRLNSPAFLELQNSCKCTNEYEDIMEYY